jgi:uncharacterized protein (TIGR03435 family)
MSRCQSLVRFLVVIAPIVLFSVNATPSRAQLQGDNANATPALYKTVSIKPSKSGISNGGVKLGPDELTATNANLQVIIEHAYGVQDDQIVGAPGWLNSKRYDIEAKADNPAAGEDGGRLLERGFLSQYFKLAVHHETRLIPVYELLIAGDGPKLRESDSDHPDSAVRVIQVGSGRIMGREVPIPTLARILSDQLGRPVVDSTKLSAHYDVTLQWSTAPESSGPPLLTAIQEQLGLKLVPQPMPKEFLVIDHIEMSSTD